MEQKIITHKESDIEKLNYTQIKILKLITDNHRIT